MMSFDLKQHSKVVKEGRAENELAIVSFLKLSLTLSCFWVALAAKFIGSLIRGKSAPMVAQPYAPVVEVSLESLKPPEEREFDLVLMGATGYTGGQALQYFAQTYAKHGEFKFAIAGRNAKALEAIKAAFPELAQAQIIVADSYDEESLMQLCERTRVVISTVGPFNVMGINLCRACIACRTHYVDTTGETEFVQNLIENYQDICVKNKVSIVNFGAHDCIPWDILAYKLYSNLNKQQLKSVKFMDLTKFIPSGGTTSTMLLIIANKVKSFLRCFGSGDEKEKKKSKANHAPCDPMMLLPGNVKSQFSTTDANIAIPRPNFNEMNVSASMFIMAGTNIKSFERTNAILGYGEKVAYKEGLAAFSFTGALSNHFAAIRMIVLCLIYPNWFLESFCGYYPNAGTGPTPLELDEGYLEVFGLAESVSGNKVAGTIYFNQEAGYRGTGKMVIECAIGVLKTKNKRFGVVTPTACLEMILFDRLVNAKVFEYQDIALSN